LDEPSLGAVRRAADGWNWVRTHRAAATRRASPSLLEEQNVAQSLEIAQRAYVLENGAIRFSGSSAELLATDHLRQAYLGV
jgi:branched-chain amino acid transport system ATP-binding protein